jgi:hypothetical protein
VTVKVSSSAHTRARLAEIIGGVRVAAAFTTINVPGAFHTQAHGINAVGKIVERFLRTNVWDYPASLQCRQATWNNSLSVDTGLIRATKRIVEPQIAVAVRVVIDQIVAAAVPGCGHARDLIV